MRDGKIDAYFATAGVPLDSVKDLIVHHVARLVPIDGEGRDRLVQMLPQLSPAAIAANAYPGQPAVETVATRAWWVTRDSEPDSADLWPGAGAVQSRQSCRPGRQPSQRARHRAGQRCGQSARAASSRRGPVLSRKRQAVLGVERSIGCHGPRLREFCVSSRFGGVCRRIKGSSRCACLLLARRACDVAVGHAGAGWQVAHRLRLMAMAAKVMAQALRASPRWRARTQP